MFHVEKHNINKLKKELKNLINKCEQTKEDLETLKFTVKMARSSFDDLKPAIDFLKVYLLYDVSCTVDKNALLEMIDGVISDMDKIIKKIEIFRNSLTTFGFENPTYSFPYFCFGCSNSALEIGLTFLLLSGIKKNATLKKAEDEMMDSELEKTLFALECKMGQYLDDECLLDPNNIAKFINILESYLLTYWRENEDIVRTALTQTDMDNILLGVCKYYIYCSAGYDVDGAILREKLEKDRASLKKADGQILDNICKKIIEEYNEMHKNNKEPIAQEKLPVLEDYIKNGQIIKLCRDSEFQAILTRNLVSKERRIIYTRAMADVSSKIEDEKFARKCSEYRKLLFTKNEIDLYDMANCNKYSTLYSLGSVLQKIDEQVELAIDEIAPLLENIRMTLNPDKATDLELYAMAKKTPELFHIVEDIDMIVEMIKEDTKPLFDVLRRGFGYGIESGEDKRVVYYTREIEDENGEKIALPQMLLSLLYQGMDMYCSIDIALSYLIDRRNSRDIKLNRKAPYTVYYDGREYKIFYTFVEDTLVIIDSLEANGDDSKKIMEIVRSDDFKKFMDSLTAEIAAGNKPNAVGYTNLIKEELSKWNRETKKMSY